MNYPVHDVRETRWRHFDFVQHRTELIAHVPRVRSAKGKVVQVEVPWARSGSGFTLLMEGFVLTRCRVMPVAAVARLVGEQDTRLWRLIHHYVGEAREKSDGSEVKRIRIDDTSTHKGHRYGTGFVEIRGGAASEGGLNARLFFLTPGKGADTIKAFTAAISATRMGCRTILSREQLELASSSIQAGVLDLPMSFCE